MGQLVSSAEMRVPLGSGSSREQREAGRTARPERLIASSWQFEPECAAHGMRSGLTAAIWGGAEDKILEVFRPALDRFHVLTFRLHSFHAERWQNGRLIQEQDTRPGSAAVTPAGIAPRGVIYGPWRSMQVYVPTALLVETAAQADLPPPAADSFDPALTYDPQLHGIANGIVQEIAQQEPGSRLQLDSLGTMVCVHLLRRAGSGRAGDAALRGGLARWQLKRATDCIAARLDENLSLAALAEEVGLSQYHFARAFKQSTGLTPHRYLLQRRLEQAKELLAKTDASVAEIAARVGYSEATQLCRLFQTELAVSPSAYRRMSTAR